MNEYEKFFSRNFPLISEDEQATLKNSHIAIAGQGGVGGIQTIALARLGIENFTIADPEAFDETNINRQYGATTKTIGKNKADVMQQILLDINPNINIKTIHNLEMGNLENFINKATLIVDAIEYFEFNIKIALYQKARQQNKHVFTSPMPAYSPSLIIFDPNGMKFEQFTNTSLKKTNKENAQELIKTLMPDASYLNPNPYKDALLKKISMPTISPSAFGSAALLSSEILFFLTQKRDIICAPYIHVVDYFTKKYKIIKK
jgi:tRNA A37 threonylcarbamoyladenosine dehydratase